MTKKKQIGKEFGKGLLSKHTRFRFPMENYWLVFFSVRALGWKIDETWELTKVQNWKNVCECWTRADKVKLECVLNSTALPVYQIECLIRDLLICSNDALVFACRDRSANWKRFLCLFLDWLEMFSCVRK